MLSRKGVLRSDFRPGGGSVGCKPAWLRRSSPKDEKNECSHLPALKCASDLFDLTGSLDAEVAGFTHARKPSPLPSGALRQNLPAASEGFVERDEIRGHRLLALGAANADAGGSACIFSRNRDRPNRRAFAKDNDAPQISVYPGLEGRMHFKCGLPLRKFTVPNTQPGEPPRIHPLDSPWSRRRGGSVTHVGERDRRRDGYLRPDGARRAARPGKRPGAPHDQERARPRMRP